MALTRAAGRTGAAAALALLWLLLCAPGDAGCRFLAVASLLYRVIRHFCRTHCLSTAPYAELEKPLPPRDNELGKPARKCRTSGMLIPNGKEHAKILREELTHLILRLLQAWKEPLSHFNQHTGHHELPDDSFSKAKQISNMIHELKTGIEKVTEKMQSMGINSNSLNGMESSEAAGLSISNEANMMSDSDFIHCFRRDANKVQSYSKILKCRIMPEKGCRVDAHPETGCNPPRSPGPRAGTDALRPALAQGGAVWCPCRCGYGLGGSWRESPGGSEISRNGYEEFPPLGRRPRVCG
ncbi:LOW QUALITY PROTEIN: prolactin-like [Ara ararauna]